MIMNILLAEEIKCLSVREERQNQYAPDVLGTDPSPPPPLFTLPTNTLSFSP